MRTTLLFIILITVFGTKCFAQYTFDIKGKTMAYARDYETTAKSTEVGLNNNYVSGAGIGPPMVYRRKEKALPDLLVYYFPNTKDSTINYILYEWDEVNFTSNRQAAKQSVAGLQPYIDKYIAIEKQAESIFGKPETSGSLTDITYIETGKFKQKDNFAKDDVSVEMYIVLSNKMETNGIVSILPTHRVRMFVRSSFQ